MNHTELMNPLVASQYLFRSDLAQPVLRKVAPAAFVFLIKHITAFHQDYIKI